MVMVNITALMVGHLGCSQGDNGCGSGEDEKLKHAGVEKPLSCIRLAFTPTRIAGKEFHSMRVRAATHRGEGRANGGWARHDAVIDTNAYSMGVFSGGEEVHDRFYFDI